MNPVLHNQVVTQSSSAEKVPRLKHRHNFFLRFFPPPKFIAPSIAGLDISNHSIRMVKLVRTPHGLSLAGHTEQRILSNNITLTPAGSTAGVGADDLHEGEVVSKTLSDIRKQFGLSFVSVSLPEDKAYIFRLELPNLPDAELRQSIEFQLEENVSMPASETVFDYVIVGKQKDAVNVNVAGTAIHTADQLEVVVTVFPKKLIKSAITMLKRSGLTPVSFSVGATAVSRALIKPGLPGTTMIVNIGETKTGICVVQDGIVEFTSTLNFGGEALNLAIQKQFSVSKEEAISMKRRQEFFKNKGAMEFFFSIINPISALRDEINRVAIYWQTHGNNTAAQRDITKVLLCGSDADLHGLDEYLTVSMKIDVEVGNVWKNVFDFSRVVPDISFADSLNYAAAIGLALPYV